MFSFFKRGKSGKHEHAAETPEDDRARPTDGSRAHAASVTDKRAPRNDNHVANERKDVVNLLIPETEYCAQRSGVGAILQHIMAGNKRKRNRRRQNIVRAESCREISPQKEMEDASPFRSQRDLDTTYKRSAVTRSADDVTTSATENNAIDAERERRRDADPAEFVKELVLQKYANKSPVQAKKQHVSLVYVTSEPDERKHAETLLREIARSIDCTLDELELNAKVKQMGATDSKPQERPRVVGRNERSFPEPVYETIDENRAFKDDLKGELEKLLNEQNKTANKYDTPDTKDDKPLPDILESPVCKRKSNLKLPKSDTEGCSDDDRSDCGKKRVTFRKHIVFDDGDQQTDEEVNSSFESISSSEEEDEEDTIPDNDELLGGVVVARTEDNRQCNEENARCEAQSEAQFKDNIINGDSSVTIRIECNGDDGLKRISSDNSDSGFLEMSDKQNDSSEDLTTEVKASESESDNESENESDSDSEASEGSVVISEEEGVVLAEIIEPEDYKDTSRNLVNQESKFQSQVAQLNELSEARCGEAERMRDQICRYRKEIEAKDLEIEHLKCQLASAYKESELVRQRSRSLEEELAAARSCSADLADKLTRQNDETLHQLRSDLEVAHTRCAELDSRVLQLERDRDRLEQEKRVHEQKAKEALTTAEANTAKWRAAHESARSQAAARAELMLADCEWKMRELEQRARDADKRNNQLVQTLEQVKREASEPSAAHVAELQQLRGLATEQQRSVQSLTIQLQKVETREEALKLEVHRLKELLQKEARISKEKEERHLQTIERLEQQHSKALETAKAEHQASAASTRAALERAHAERTRAALAQLRADAERDHRNADRKLREVTTRFENLKETLVSKEEHFNRALSEANSRADWELLQLRHLLDKADITYANNIDQINEKFEKEKEELIEEWTEKLKEVEEMATNAAEEASKMLETTRMRLTAEKVDQVNKLKEQHRREMDDQWEQFMTDKETCLSRMKAECRLEGEEERVKREKELLEEIAELKLQIQSKSLDFDNLAVKTAACGRTLAVTEQELREALAREKELREKRSEETTKLKQMEKASREKIEHLTRKCACLRKLFDDMRARLTARDRAADQESKAKDKELHQLRAEVARLTKILVEQSSPKLGARTRADGCDAPALGEGLSTGEAAGARRKGGGALRTPEFARRLTTSALAPLPPELRPRFDFTTDGRRRAKSVDLPAVQVPVRIKQLEEKK